MASSPRPPEWANKVKAGVLMDRLRKAGLGEVEMTTTQINAAKAFLAKVIPDLARTELMNAPGETFKTETKISDSDKEILSRFLNQQKEQK